MIANPTKADELNELRTFVDVRPGTYLADILGDASPAIERLIQADLCFGLGAELSTLMQSVIDCRNELRELHKQVVAARSEADFAERRTGRARNELQEIKAQALLLARTPKSIDCSTVTALLTNSTSTDEICAVVAARRSVVLLVGNRICQSRIIKNSLHIKAKYVAPTD